MKRFISILFTVVFFSASLYAQKDTVDVASDVTEGNLNTAIEDAINNGTLSNTVFRLEAYGYYVLSGEIITPQGEVLDIVAPEPGTTQATAPPQIVWTSSSAVTKDRMFDLQGDFIMKNVWVRYADVAGVQVGSTIQFEDDPLANQSGKGERCNFEGCIIDYSRIPPTNSGGSVNVLAQHFKGTFINTYFRNCTDAHYRYYGRAVSFPYDTEGWHYDSLYFENCTFDNMGYVIMQEGSEYGDNIFFNHCTFVNIAMFSLESGWWYKLAVNNCVWLNAYMFGWIPINEDAGSGTFNIQHVDDFGFTVPFTDQDRRILFTNSSYYLEPWLVDWQTTSSPWAIFLHNNRRDDEIPQPQPMLGPTTLVFFDSVSTQSGEKAYPYMNKASLYDSTDPGFIIPPTNIDSIKAFLNEKWDTNFDVMWAYDPESGYLQEWPLPEDLSYNNATLKTAGMGGFPLGDLYHWWPTEYEQWKAQEDVEHNRINTWLDTGHDPFSAIETPGTVVASSYILNQNYPNPFNPTTSISYSIPKSEHVTLTVYNLLGQEVATLVDGVRVAGEHVVKFDAGDLASGVYLYRLASEDVSLTKKLVLMR